MRTDVKIGVVVALLLALAIVVYNVVFSGPGTDPNQDGNQVAQAGREPGGEGGGVVRPRFGAATPPSPPSLPEPPAPVRPLIETPAAPPEPVVPVIPSPPAPSPAAPEPATPVAPPTPVTPIIETTPPAPATPPAAPEPVRPVVGGAAAATPPEPPVVGAITEPPPAPEPIRPVITPAPGAGTGPTPAPARPGTPGTYVVQKGDQGFWAVAVKVYGDGRLWPQIARANPKVDSNTLKPGQKLVIPPKPAAEAPAVAPAGGAGGLSVSATGEKYYTVKEGDHGFWAIAEAVYGNGKYWPLLAKANPKLDSARLKAGQKVLVPARPVEAAPAASAPAVVAGPGQKVYVVRKSDTTGFSGIARKVYGDARFWPLIAEANPGVNSASLRVGQKLVLPELTDAARARLAGRATSRTAGRSSSPPRRSRPKDVEDIGPEPVFP